MKMASRTLTWLYAIRARHGAGMCSEPAMRTWNDVAATVPTVARATFHHASHSVFVWTAVPPTPLVRCEATNARPPWNRGGRGPVTAGRADPAELPVAAERGGDDLLGLARLGADVLADRHVAFDDRVAERAEPVDLDLDDVAGLRPGASSRACPTGSRRRARA